MSIPIPPTFPLLSPRIGYDSSERLPLPPPSRLERLAGWSMRQELRYLRLDRDRFQGLLTTIGRPLLFALFYWYVARCSLPKRVAIALAIQFKLYWPTNGIFLSSLLLANRNRVELMYAVLLCSSAIFLANICDVSLWITVHFTAMHAVATLIPYACIRWCFAKKEPKEPLVDVEDQNEVFWLGCACTIGSAMGVLLGSFWLDWVLGGGTSAHWNPISFFSWFGNDCLGCMIAPAALLRVGRPSSILYFIAGNPRGFLAGLFLVLLTVVQAGGIPMLYFYFPFFSFGSYIHFTLYIGFTLVLIVGNHWGPMGVLVCSILLRLAALRTALLGSGPYSDFAIPPEQAIPIILQLEIYMIALSLATIAFSVIFSQKTKAVGDLEEATANSELLHAQKSAFMSFLCHELRNPLHAITNLIDFLRESPLTPEQKEMFNALLVSSSYMSDLVNDVLDTGKFEAGKVQLELLPVDIRDLMESLFRTADTHLKPHGIRFETHVGHLPETVLTDPLRIQQVMCNLFSNATKFTPKGGTVGFRAFCSSNLDVPAGKQLLTLAVSDTGIGMAPEEVGKLFSPYAQASISTSREYGGSGLGLVIVKHILDLMGGSIRVESAVGTGTTFIVTIPLQVVTNKDPNLLLNACSDSCSGMFNRR